MAHCIRCGEHEANQLIRRMTHAELSCLTELAPQASFASLLSDRMFNDDSYMLIIACKTEA